MTLLAGTPEWLAARRNGIGASEVVALCACGCGRPIPPGSRVTTRRGKPACLAGHYPNRPKLKPDDLWLRVAIGDGCWEWTGPRGTKGYGLIQIAGVSHATHRLSWELKHGLIPDGLCILHRCDNPPCVRPSHLFLGTPGDNNRDTSAKGRNKYGEAHGRSKLTIDQAVAIRSRRLAGESVSSLSREFDIARGVVRQIAAGTLWRRAIEEAT